MSRHGPAAKRPSGQEGPCPVGIAPPLSREKQRQRKKTSAPPRRARWGFVREVSPYSSQLGRCSPLWRALRAIARQSGYPRFARLAIGRGAAAFGARQSLFKRLANSASPAPRGECESSPQSRLNCALPLGARALALCVPFPQRVPFGFPPPRPIRLCLARPLCCPCFALSGAGRGLRCVRLR